ncbi:MAG TPA: J domain-containing protein [Mycobacterium sp.]
MQIIHSESGLLVRDPYTVLNVSPIATPDEITRAYRRQLRVHHPDIRSAATEPSDNPDADGLLREILDAYALLRDPRRRAQYDRSAGRRAGRRAGDPSPVRVTISGCGTTGAGQPPLRAGPVRWHRGG